MDLQRELTAAPAIPLLLTILAEGESPGFAIIREARQRAGGRLDWVDAMVYPLFHRMLRLGYVTSDWRVVPEGGRRRFYAITDLGREALVNSRRLSTGFLSVMGGVWPGLLTMVRPQTVGWVVHRQVLAT
jgi:DNA-binding PadR family transcriptional regulator